nr:arsenate reductase, glutathione/glutaredoxin type [Pseudanabaena sp. PCC 6802]
MITLKPATTANLEYIEQLLAVNGLPIADIPSKLDSMFLGQVDSEIVGIGGIELYGVYGLLRSLAIALAYRKKGYGRAIAEQLMAYAQSKGVRQVYLLTTLESGFFTKMGFEQVDRDAVPPIIQNTSQFVSLCPTTAICLRKVLSLPKVMFVCKKNSRRSQMAEGFTRIFGSGKVEVTSSGLESSQVDPITMQVMSEIGIDISLQTSKPLSDFDPANYDAVISLCGCGVNLPEAWVLRDIFEDWQLDDPEGEGIDKFREVRDLVKVKVMDLIERLARAY